MWNICTVSFTNDKKEEAYWINNDIPKLKMHVS